MSTRDENWCYDCLFRQHPRKPHPANLETGTPCTCSCNPDNIPF